MRKVFVVLIAAVAAFGLVAPPHVFAQAAAPAPKVTISGLVDFVASWYKNTTGDTGNVGALTINTPFTGAGAGNSAGVRDITNSRDKGWYSRERGVFTLTGEVGKSKGVLALEFDFHNGHTANNLQDGGFGGNGGIDAETDEKAQVEVKWLYLETPVTGPGSLIPFIPVTTMGRFGAQAASGIDYKPGILVTGDFPGVTLTTTWAPNLRSTLAYLQYEARLDPVVNGQVGKVSNTNDFAVAAAVELDVFKGLTVKPEFGFLRCVQGCQGNNGNRLSTPLGQASGVGIFARGGFDPANDGTTATGGNSSLTANGQQAANAAQTDKLTRRYTIGGDVKWTSGPFSLAPTFLYQWGTQEINPTLNSAGKEDVKIRSWILDVIGGFRTGPLTIEVRGMWTPGNKITECVNGIPGVCGGGDKIKYYEPYLNGTSAYFAGWSEIESSGIDYNNTLRSPGSGTQLGRSPSYDKYGRRVLAAAADYALTPALTFHLVTNFQWTDERVNRGSAVAATSAGGGGLSLIPRGDDNKARYLGNEWDAGFTYRFAPNVAFDLIGAVLFAGRARDLARNVTDESAIFRAQDVYKTAARLRLTW